MYAKNISISLKEDLIERLKHFVPAKKISKFISMAINNELIKAEQELASAYEQAEADELRQDLLSEWDEADDFFTN